VKRCVIISAVLPSVRALKRPSQSCSAQESIELVGSSRITSEACLKNARARAIRCHSLEPACYDRLLDFFHSPALDLSKLTLASGALWSSGSTPASCA
jgi:hypothetical protein